MKKEDEKFERFVFGLFVLVFLMYAAAMSIQP